MALAFNQVETPTDEDEKNGEHSRRQVDLAAIVLDGTAYHYMVGGGENYLPAFILFVGLSEVSSGLLAVVPMLLGAVLQLAAPMLLRRVGCHKRWVVVGAAIQGIALASTLLALVVPDWAIGWTLLITITLYWAAGHSGGPAWNTWVEEIIPQPVRAQFFGRRQRFCQAGLLAGFIAAGLLLHFGRDSRHVAMIFAVVFGVAAAARLFSAWCLSRQSAPARPIIERTLSPREMLGRMRRDAGPRLLLYLFAVQTVVQISGPYFTPFMLRKLNFSFLEYTLLLSAAFLGKIVASPIYGRLAQRIGPRRLLWIGGTAIIPAAALWNVSQSLPFLIGVQLVSGVAWAAYELAMFLLFFEAVPRHERTSVLTYYNLGNSAAMAGGALIGGALLSSWGESYNGYLMLFAISSTCRVGTLGLLYYLSRPMPAFDTDAVPVIAGRIGPVPLTESEQQRPAA